MCIFCDTFTKSPYDHCVRRCANFAVVRAELLSLLTIEFTLTGFLNAAPSEAHFPLALKLASKIDKGAYLFWRQRGVKVY